ncbi:hypothetical protein NDU88_006655 [Pleurodeles waltl]|uniref:Uncharacterized protein n=1 Tax=Pleurodeles waltl TaxID=8319 RepID=A0AAV7U0R7_PLEWA|nr:hypothetical protein NDU88_006655 [Pleurodeles waltl]
MSLGPVGRNWRVRDVGILKGTVAPQRRVAGGPVWLDKRLKMLQESPVAAAGLGVPLGTLTRPFRHPEVRPAEIGNTSMGCSEC